MAACPLAGIDDLDANDRDGRKAVSQDDNGDYVGAECRQRVVSGATRMSAMGRFQTGCFWGLSSQRAANGRQGWRVAVRPPRGTGDERFAGRNHRHCAGDLDTAPRAPTDGLRAGLPTSRSEQGNSELIFISLELLKTL